MTHLRIADETLRAIDAVWPEMLEQLANGRQVNEIVKEHNTTTHVLRAYKAHRPEAHKEWDDAWNASADAFFDEVLELLEDLKANAAKMSKSEISGIRARMQGLFWVAGKRNPRVYGDHKTLDINMAFADMTSVLAEAQKRRDDARAHLLHQRGLIHEAQAVIEDALPAVPDVQNLL